VSCDVDDVALPSYLFFLDIIDGARYVNYELDIRRAAHQRDEWTSFANARDVGVYSIFLHGSRFQGVGRLFHVER
jgi:hypothetical protein